MKDSQIVKLFFDRDEHALDLVEAQYGNVIHSISLNTLGNEQDAEECINDTYMALWHSIPPASPDSLYAFVCKVARNVSFNRLRYNSASRRRSENTVCLDDVADFLPDGKLIDDELEEDELSRLLNSWLESLDTERRYIFMRKYWYMDSAETIGRALGISASAVYLRIGRMKKQLYRYLKERGVTL